VRTGLRRIQTLVVCSLFLLAAACTPAREPGQTEDAAPPFSARSNELRLPEIGEASAHDGPIRIVVTTGIIGDVTKAIAGDDAQVDVLMAPNQDPHGYQSKAGDLQLAANADVVLVNGWRLEEGLIDDLENAAGDVPLVPVSAGIKPLVFGNDGNRPDPHVWLSPLNVLKWADNIQQVLSKLDPANASSYARRADEYQSRLHDLDTYIQQQFSPIDRGQRVMVTSHDAFGYYADRYGLTVIGTIVPGGSSLSEPASRDLATLVEQMRSSSVCTIFVERSVNQRLATRLADELKFCDGVQIVTLYSGALGEDGSGAETYISMMKTNTDLIAGGLTSKGGRANATSG
jgi:zinc/manganese transport system substrate-binding protein